MIRFIIVAIFIFLFFTIGQITLVIGFLISLFNKQKADAFYRNVVRFVFDMIIFISGVSIEIENEISQFKTPCMVIANHRSFFDVIILYHYLKFPISFIAKKELLSVPFLGFWMKKINCLFLERDDIRQQFNTMIKAINNINQGFSYVIFPEGTRNKNIDEKDLLPFKDGSFILAKKTNCYIYPISISNTYQIFEKQMPKIRKTRVKLTFSEPLVYNDLSDDNKNNIGSFARNLIINMLSK